MKNKKINQWIAGFLLCLWGGMFFCSFCEAKTVEDYLEHARQYQVSEEYEKALLEYSECIKNCAPSQGEAGIDYIYYKRGQLYLFGMDKPAKAISDANSAIKIQPLSGYYYLRGQAYFSKKSYAKAIKDFEQAIQLDSEHFKTAENYAAIAECYLELRDYGQAIRSYSQALEIEPDNVAYLNDRGVIYYDLLNYKAAKKDWSKVIALAPNSATAQLAQDNLNVLSQYIDIHADDDVLENKEEQIKSESSKDKDLPTKKKKTLPRKIREILFLLTVLFGVLALIVYRYQRRKDKKKFIQFMG